MKKIVLAALATLFILSGSATGARAAEFSRTYELKNFDEVEIFNVNKENRQSLVFRRHYASNSWYNGDLRINADFRIVKSDSYMVDLTVNDEEYAGMFEVIEKGGCLYINIVPPEKNVRTTINVSGVIQLPSLTSLRVHRNAHVSMSDEFSTDGEFLLMLTGQSQLSGLSMKAGSASVQCSGQSALRSTAITCGGSVDVVTSGQSSVKNCSFGTTGQTSLQISGQSWLRMTDIETESLFAQISGQSGFKPETISFVTAKLSVSGQSSASAAKSSSDKENPAEELRLDVSGQSKADFSDYPCKQVRVQASGQSSARVYASESVDYYVTGNASLDYYGNPATVSGNSKNVRAH